MGLFDFFKRKNKDTSDSSDSDTRAPQTKADKSIARLGRVAASKQAQNFDRYEAIRALSTIGTADSAAALLKRFSFYVDPSITDQEEKDVAFQGIIAAGSEAIEPIREFCVKAESFTWPMKMLSELLDESDYIDELLVLLGRFDTDYAKKQEPKLQIIAELEGKVRSDIPHAVEPFLDDFDERVRFHTVATLLAQQDPELAEPLCNLLLHEESLRVRNRICEGLAANAWPVPEALQSEVQDVLADGYVLQHGLIQQRN